MRILTVLSAAAVASVALAGCGQSSSPKSAADASSNDCGNGPASSHLVRTAGYELVAAAGPIEATYTEAQVASQHPATGEMMIRGEMMGEPGMAMSGDAGPGMSSTGPTGTGMGASPGDPPPVGAYRHIEVHICSRASGQVVQNAAPSMTLIDTSEHGLTQQLPIAVMQGVHSGVADMHYGNNASAGCPIRSQATQSRRSPISGWASQLYGLSRQA